MPSFSAKHTLLTKFLIRSKLSAHVLSCSLSEIKAFFHCSLLSPRYLLEAFFDILSDSTSAKAVQLNEELSKPKYFFKDLKTKI